MTPVPLRKTPSVRSADGAVGFEDLFSVPGASRYYHLPSRGWWTREFVNSILPGIPTGEWKSGKPVLMPAADWLDRYRRVEQSTYAPGESKIIESRLLSANGWEKREGVHVLNFYDPPQCALGDASKAGWWIDHMRRLYPNEADEIMDWCAFKVQHPEIKINHALFLGGGHGIGKDWIMQGLAAAVGPDNYKTVKPSKLVGKNNPFAKTVILVVNEARDEGDGGRIDRFKLYESTKDYAASPPLMLECEDKYIRSHPVLNTLGLAILSNHKTDGIFLESDDRRHLMAWSDVKKEEFTDGFWDERYKWIKGEGAGHVAAYLRQRDVTNYKPGAPPRKTAAFHEIVDASTAPEDDDLADALDELKRPNAVTLAMLLTTSCAADLEWMLKGKRAVPHRLERCGYVIVKNPNDARGKWSINGKGSKVYAKFELSPVARQLAAEKLTRKAATAGTF